MSNNDPLAVPAWVRRAATERARARKAGVAPRGMVAVNPEDDDAFAAYARDAIARAPKSWIDAMEAALKAPVPKTPRRR